MGFLNGTKVITPLERIPEIIDVIGNKKNGLAKINVDQGLNDKQMMDVCEYYGIKW